MNSPESPRIVEASRVVIEEVSPVVDGGRFPAKAIESDRVAIRATAFADGHDRVACVLRYRHEAATGWTEVPMASLGNDEWMASFVPDRIGTWHFGIEAWIDTLSTWREQFARREDPADLQRAAGIGAELVALAAEASEGKPREQLAVWAEILMTEKDPVRLRAAALDEALFRVARVHLPRFDGAQSAEYRLGVERVRARFSTWYELFPRSCGENGAHGTFADVEKQLPRIQRMGFDVLYLPPIHPIGRERRKGRNNTTVGIEGDVGSPWAIGAAEGGHMAILPALGDLADFRHLVAAARERGIEIALDIAFQCAPDHPYVRDHPSWFRQAPDGSVQYAENPPKKYQDIYPFDFDCADATGLWEELLSVFTFWIGQGVQAFRVDNPHTKPFAFWEWVIAEVKRRHPQVIFLSEAFTRPHVMHQLAKAGFTQSYTYFTWRTTKAELTEYFTELAHGPGRDYFRPNVWPNTPDILALQLRGAPPAAFRLRLVLAATLCASYGIYGPAFELCENRPRDPEGEEYLESEKYELKAWDLARAEPMEHLIAKVNRARHEHPALQWNDTLAFHETDSEHLIAFSKRAGGDQGDVILVVVNLDPLHEHSGWVMVEGVALGVAAGTRFWVEDLLDGARYPWQAGRNFVRLEPRRAPAHLFHVAFDAGPLQGLVG